ncbi:MAG: hypothetical protein ABSG55_07635 [Dehalococcoidia bacterium]|jgi:hypothetical protein
MFKKALILAGVIVTVVAVACGGSSKSSDNTGKSATTAATSATTGKASPTAGNVAPTAEATVGGSSDTSFNPLSFLTGDLFGTDALAAEGAVAGDASPDLKSVLLTESDLPSGFQAAAGDSGYTLDLPDGQLQAAIRTFAQGGVSADSGPSGPAVISAAMTMPASELSKFDSQLGQLDQMSASDLDKELAGASALGVTVKDFSLKQVDIGDGGASLHMVIDMSGLAEAFGGSSDQLGAFQNGIAFDGYMFRHGQLLLMTMTMWPAGQDSAVDALALAKIMDSRAGNSI